VCCFSSDESALEAKKVEFLRSEPRCEGDLTEVEWEIEGRGSQLSSKIVSFWCDEVGGSAGFRGLPTHAYSNQVNCHILPMQLFLVDEYSCSLCELLFFFNRCDLIIIANGKTEKIVSGLLDPFLAHLKTAQDQIAKGGYSIILEPDPETNAAWFTKGTIERFVRFVSTPEVLERVTTIESEILQIENAIAIQGNDNLGLSTVCGRLPNKASRNQRRYFSH
ncbi:hypothetical protein B296_00028710, partial [Ensete ventricosum]